MNTVLKPGVSLCMIVRDEAELLPKCLERAAGVWDELCVVDTGSQDATPEIVRAAGGSVVEFLWRGDFAAARNASLAAAQCEWVLVLDADELISAGLVQEIRAVANDASVGAATVVMHNALPHGHRRQSRLLRLFRNHPQVRYQHRIHEDASESVFARLAATGQKPIHLKGGIEHLGYVRERAQARNKKTRDVGLLEAQLAAAPDDFYSHYKLLEQARFWEDTGLAKRAASRALAALERQGHKAVRGAHYGGALLVFVAQALHRGQTSRALRFLEQWWAPCGHQAAMLLYRGELRELKGETALAKADFESCLAQSGQLGDLQLATVRPLLGLARLALGGADFARAKARADEALTWNARDPEALLARVVVARITGGNDAVVRFAQAHTAQYGASVELDEALGEEAMLAGQSLQAAQAFARAAGNPPKGPAAVQLAKALLAIGEVGTARALAVSLQAEFPEASLGVLVCDLLEGQDSELEVALSAEAADAAMRAWVDVLKLKHSERLLGRFQTMVPVIESVFPWLPAYVGVGAVQGV